MYIVLAYDISSKKINKVKKLCDKYLFHIQKSVYEGEITEKNLHRLEDALRDLVNPSIDSIVIYRFRTPQSAEKDTIGTASNIEINFL